MVQVSRIQWSRIAVYWAVATFGLALLWSILLNMLELSGMGPAVTIAVPGILGAVFAAYIYKMRVHQVLEYDENGYSIVKGRSEKDEHKWSEFKETSVVKDSYGRTKVRVYRERDGEHFDIDSRSCGVDPIFLRDFAAQRMTRSAPESSRMDLFSGLEQEIQRGRAYWIADLNETFRYYEVSGDVFQLMARGSTRPKGFLLSRFIAVTVMPNYEVALYAHSVGKSDAKGQAMRLIRIVETLRDRKNVKWSWLLLFSEEEPPSSLSSFVQEFGNKDVGIGIIDVSTGQLTTSKNQLGVSLARQMRMNRLIRDLSRRSHGQLRVAAS